MRDIFREIKQEVTFYTTHQLDYPAHIHEDIELVYVIRGGGIVYCDGKRYTLQERCFFLTFPNQVHHYIGCTQGDYILLILKPYHLLGNHSIYSNGYPTSALQQVEEDSTAITLLMTALREYNGNGSDLLLQATLTAFFEKLISYYDIDKGRVSSDTVWRILQYCSEHFKEDISVTDLAEALGISNSTVSHIFGQRLGIRFNDHIHTLRLSEAAQLLQNRHYSVTDVSSMTGFSTIRTFNRAFRKQYGLSPTEYRKALHRETTT